MVRSNQKQSAHSLRGTSLSPMLLSLCAGKTNVKLGEGLDISCLYKEGEIQKRPVVILASVDTGLSVLVVKVMSGRLRMTVCTLEKIHKSTVSSSNIS